MTHQEALELLKEKIKNQNLIKHCLAVEACMRALARRFGEDEEKWALAGLLHDIDYEETKENPNGLWLAFFMILTMRKQKRIRKSIPWLGLKCWIKWG